MMNPLSAYRFGNNRIKIHLMLMRLIDFLEEQDISGLFANLTKGDSK